MLCIYGCVPKRASAGVLLRTIGVASATALMAGVSMAGAFDNQPAEPAALPALNGEPSIAAPEPRANPDAYAQLFFLERLFAPPAPDRSQNSNPSRAHGKQHRAGQGDIYIRSRDRAGNRGPTYRVIGAVPRKPKTRNQGSGDYYKAQIAKQLRNAPPVPPTTGPLLLAVSLSKQTVTLYDAGVPIATSPVSTGTASHPTPTGIFSVIEKQWWHRSNLYSAAPMPFMQRITWTGVALHAGVLPGYAASHGCIRLPDSFALRLWGTTKIGARVIITKDEVAPAEIVHARLFSPKAKAEPALEPKPEQQLKPEQELKPEPVAPPEHSPQSEQMSISDNSTTLSLAARQTERAPESVTAPQTDRISKRAALLAPSPEPEPIAPVIVRPPDYVGGGPRVIVVPEEQSQLAAANPAADEEDDVADNGIDDETRTALQNVELVDPENTVINGTAEVTIALPGQPAETLLLAVEKMPADAGQPAPESEPRVMLASLDSSMVPMLSQAMSNNTQLAKRRIQHRRSEPTVEMSAVQPHVLRPGPISVLISRKDQRMYIRKGFEPLFDVPITIANPREATGTYLFTAVAQGADESTLRWTVVPLETSSGVAYAADDRASSRTRSRAPERIDPKVKIVATASAVLDRLDLPQEAVDRISELVSVGASLIVTERGLSRREAAAIDSDFTVQIDNSPAVKAKPRKRQKKTVNPLL